MEDPQLLADRRAAVGVALALWATAGLASVLVAVPATAEAVQGVDDIVYRFAVSSEQWLLVGLATVLDVLGATVVTAPLMVTIGLYLAWRRRWGTLAFWVLAMVASQLLIGPLKEVYARPRPPDSLVTTSGFSYPSGHAVAGSAIAVALVFVLVPVGPGRRRFGTVAIVFVLLMSMSRVYLRAHWLSDAVAGAALGAAASVTAALVVHGFETRRTKPVEPPQ